MKFIGTVAALVFTLILTPAEARHHRSHTSARTAVLAPAGSQDPDKIDQRFPTPFYVPASHTPGVTVERIRVAGNDPRPHAWCGWQMRQWLGVADRAYNLARNWAHYGSNAGSPAVGEIVVWPHHVGLITGQTDSGFVIKSGNDGHQVRERERSLRGAIAFRWPSRVAGL